MIFDNVSPVLADDVSPLIKEVQYLIGLDVYVIGSAANPKKEHKDIDVLASIDRCRQIFGSKTDREARKMLREHVGSYGIDSRIQGVSVHIRIPWNNKHHQIDVMLATDIETIKFYHIHNIPRNSRFKGKHRHMLLNYLASGHGYKWSPYKGIIDNANNMIANNPDDVSRLLLGETASHVDILNAETILAKISNPDDVLDCMAKNPYWNK